MDRLGKSLAITRATISRIILLYLGWFLFASSGRLEAADPVCSQIDESGGQGVRVVRNCVAAASGFNTFDAYYRVAITVRPGPGFANQARFNKRSPTGRVLAGLLSLFADAERATTVDLGVTITQGNTVYPRLSILAFRKVNDDEWTSTIRADSRSFFHRLGASQPFNMKLSYAYSRTSSVDLNIGANLIQSVGINLVTPATQPILSAANTITNGILQAGDIRSSQSNYDFTLSPDVNRNVSYEFQVLDPRTNAIIATVRLTLEGTRSLLEPAREHSYIQGTLPTGRVEDVTLNSLPRQIATGQAQEWELPNVALASTSLTAVPLWKEPNPSEIAAFCTTVASGLTSNYRLSSFDSLLVRANLLNLAAQPIKAKINPFPLCFEQIADRNLIRTHLGIDTEYSIAPPPPAFAPFSDVEALYRFGCLFTGQLGPDCSAADATPERITQSIDAMIEVAFLEGIEDEQVYGGLPLDRTISAANFSQRFGSQFAHFRSIRGASGTMQLQEREGGPWLTLLAERGPSGKLRRITIRR